MLQISNFKKYYGQTLILQIDELFIPKGIHWFKGINGSGKSTFFKSLAGILPFEGMIKMDTLDIRHDDVAYRMKVNYSEAEPIFPDYLTGKDIMRFVAKTKQASPEQTSQLIDILQVSSFLNAPIASYSSGMLKKIALLLAFLGKPTLIILDEPLITIDNDSVHKVYDLIKRYHEEFGVSFLLSSHQDFHFSELSIDHTFWVKNNTLLLTN